MGYRHNYGYIPKAKLPEIRAEIEKIKENSGTENVTYDIYQYLQKNCVQVTEISKLYWKSVKPIYDVLYKNKTEDFLPEADFEFFLVDNPKFFYDISRAYATMDNNYFKSLINSFDILLKYKDTDIKTLSIDEQVEFYDAKESIETARNLNTFTEKYYINSKVKEESNKPPYDPDLYTVLMAEAFKQHQTFDYENNVICVFAS